MAIKESERLTVIPLVGAEATDMREGHERDGVANAKTVLTETWTISPMFTAPSTDVTELARARVRWQVIPRTQC